jgi:hypothetical protein
MTSSDSASRIRLKAADEALAVLKPLGGEPAAMAQKLRTAVADGKEPEPKLLLGVSHALLDALMDPKVKSSERPKVTGFSGIFSRLTPVLPTRSQIRKVYKEFEQVFRPSRLAAVKK